MKKNNIILILIISSIILLARFIPHAPNFSPLASILLFTGAYSSNKKMIVIPLVALFVSDIFIGFYHIGIMLSVYSSFIIIYILGIYLKNNKNISNTLLTPIYSALLFFFVTNFAVWIFSSWYTHNLSGLLLNYTLAVPFFKNTLLSNIIYSYILFASYEIIQLYIRKYTYNKI